MISDPYALAAHIFGMGVNPLLKEHEHYSEYWNKKNINRVASIRSPIVHASEVNILNFQDNDVTEYWYKHIHSGIIFPANGVGMDSAIQGGSDYDLDLVCTIDSYEIIKGRTEGLPILYNVQKAEKIKIIKETEKDVLESQIKQIKTNKIGFFTNLSSSFYSLLDNFSKDTPEHFAIYQRLKYGRVLQGLAIDKAKGVLTDPFPEHFSKWKKITESMTEEEKTLQTFYNSIVGNHRPYFMRWLYSHYNKRYLKELSVYENISQTKWGISFLELEKVENKILEQDELLNRYKKKSFFINSNSTMNRITKYIESELKNIKNIHHDLSNTFDYRELLSKEFKIPFNRDLEKMQILFKEYKSLKRSIRENHLTNRDENYFSNEQIIQNINQKAYSTITSNIYELSDIAIYFAYVKMGNQAKNFCWSVFGKEIVEVLKNKYTEKFIRVPLPSPKGSIKYLWNNYGIFLLNLEEI